MTATTLFLNDSESFFLLRNQLIILNLSENIAERSLANKIIQPILRSLKTELIDNAYKQVEAIKYELANSYEGAIYRSSLEALADKVKSELQP